MGAYYRKDIFIMLDLTKLLKDIELVKLSIEKWVGVLDGDSRYGGHAEHPVSLKGLQIRLNPGPARRIRTGNSKCCSHETAPSVIDFQIKGFGHKIKDVPAVLSKKHNTSSPHRQYSRI